MPQLLLNMTPRTIKVGNLYGFTGGSFAGMIYSPQGLCPTINCMGGGNREPMIALYEDGRNDMPQQQG